MMDPFTRLLAVLLINFLILMAARHKRIFDGKGLVAAFSVGFIIGWLGDISWLVLLLLFMFTGFVATRYKFALKEQMGVQEGKEGERGWENVMATGLVPTVVAALTWDFPGVGFMPVLHKDVGALVFISAIAVAASDTLASELGVLSNRVYLITSLKRVPVGTDGGVSVWGQLWAFVAAAYAAVAGYVFLWTFSGGAPYSPVLWLVPLFAGFVGCQIDSVLGATVEGKWFIGKHSVNIISIALGTVLAWLVIL